MNILLLEPPAVSKFGNQRIFGACGSNKSDIRRPPLDLMMISGYLRKNGYDNFLIDANSSRRTLADVKDIIKNIKPEIVIFSTSTCTIYKDLLVAKVAKEATPDTLTVAIGTHGMVFPEETLREGDYLDAVIYSGEWEEVSLNIVRNFPSLNQAKGIVYKASDGKFVKTEWQLPLKNLDDLGFPSHDKLEKDIYKDTLTRRFPKTMVMAQKACTNNCSFCCQPAFFGAPILRKRSVEHFLEELKWIQQLGFREVMFNDATLTADIEWATNLFEGMLRNSTDLVWNCSARADHVDREVLKLMKRAGCHTIAIGLESANAAVLNNIRKNVTPQQVKEAVSLIREEGIDTLVFCVIGFPEETRESILETISFLKTLDTTYITLGIAIPVPGTDFYRYLKTNNYLHTKDWSLYDPMKKPVFSYPWLSSDEMHHYSTYGIQSFYLRPNYILDRILSIRSLADVERYLGNFMGFLKRYVLPRRV